jgi:hypothetical protein
MIATAIAQGRIVGVVEVRPPSHVAQLFVERTWQDRGVSRGLIEHAFPESVTRNGLTVTVNSPPESVSGYGRMGFRVIAPEQVRNGVRFVPMVRNYGPVFFPVSLRKFVLMSLFSLGVYHLSWVYWNWRYERERAGERLSPFWRTFLAPFWLHSLFHRIKETGKEVGASARWWVGVLTVSTIALWCCSLLPMPWTVLSLVGFLPSVPVQRTVNEVNRRLAPGAPTNDRLSAGNVILILIGAAILAALVWSMFVGTPASRSGTVSV